MKKLINTKRAKKANLYFSGLVARENFNEVMKNLNARGHMDLVEDGKAELYIKALLPGKATSIDDMNEDFVTRMSLLPAVGTTFVTAMMTSYFIAGTFETKSVVSFILTIIVSLIASCSLGLLVKAFYEKALKEKIEKIKCKKHIVLRGKFLYPSLVVDEANKLAAINICDLKITDIPLKDFRNNEHLFGGLPLIVVIEESEEDVFWAHIFPYRPY